MKKEKTAVEATAEQDIQSEQLEVLQNQLKEADEKILRTQAEFMNYKRRKEEELLMTLKYANMDIIRELLPIMDNFERAVSINNQSEEVNKFLAGFKMMNDQLKNMLSSYGVKEIDALDKPFDPYLYEAVITEENKDKESGIVLEVLQKGYMLNDKVIRPAMVKVNK